MGESQAVAERGNGAALFVLGVDTCGPSGWVALARIEGEKARPLGQKELAGRTYSATLVSAIAEILAEAGQKPAGLGAIVVVSGPGSFTGVRLGLSAVKGLAEPGQIPVVAVSRLEVMAAKAGVEGAALDAHRREVYLRVSEGEGGVRELLAGAEELLKLGDIASPVPKCEGPCAPEILVAGGSIAICEDAVESLLKQVWPGTNLVRTQAPTALDAIEVCTRRVLTRDFADLAKLDGYYLRRSDAEIFGGPEGKSVQGTEIRVRRMRPEDVNRVMGLAAATHHAPGWPREAYQRALNSDARPRRVALVAEEAASGALAGFVVASSTAPEAELEFIVTSLAHQRRGIARELFAALKYELRRLGAREVVLEVRAGNKAAQGFYRFLGFAEVGRRPSYYADPVDDAILMRLGLG